LEITFRVAGLDEIKRWVLSFGPEACVLEPQRLVQMVQEDLKDTLGNYIPARVMREAPGARKFINLFST